MINFFKTCFFTFTIWIVAAFINSLLYAVIFNLGNIVKGNFSESMGLAFLFTLLFSAPAVFILWITFLANSGSENLSRLLLRAVFILSLVSCLFIVFVPDEVYKGHWLLLSFIIVASSVSSVLLHHRFLKSFYHPQTISHV